MILSLGFRKGLEKTYGTLFLFLGFLAQAQAEAPRGSIWDNGVGNGFVKGAQEISVSGGAGLGMRILGSHFSHDLALAAVDYGVMLTETKGRWPGNLEVVGEQWGGFQLHPDERYIVSATPFLRYNFATGTRLVPFLGGGAGVTATGIRNGELSTTCEFNLQAVCGARYFLKDNFAINLEYRFMHISNAGIKYPNLGVNTCLVLIGGAFYF